MCYTGSVILAPSVPNLCLLHCAYWLLCKIPVQFIRNEAQLKRYVPSSLVSMRYCHRCMWLLQAYICSLCFAFRVCACLVQQSCQLSASGKSNYGPRSCLVLMPKGGDGCFGSGSSSSCDVRSGGDLGWKNVALCVFVTERKASSGYFCCRKGAEKWL